jgi:hypothetical protein
MLPSEYLSKKLTPYPLPTKDGGVLRTIDDARGYMLAMPKRFASLVDAPDPIARPSVRSRLVTG